MKRKIRKANGQRVRTKGEKERELKKEHGTAMSERKMVGCLRFTTINQTT